MNDHRSVALNSHPNSTPGPIPTPTARTPPDCPHAAPSRPGPACTRRALLSRAAGALAGVVAGGAVLAAPSCATTTRPNASRASGRWRHDPAVAAPNTPREFRGVWVATVANIDWPAKGTTDSGDLREQTSRIIRACKRLNLNAIILQVRPSCDTIYPSRYEPWSEFVTGRSGQAPDAGFDPLQDWIDQARGAGMELHAWFNPFRARHQEAKGPDAASHVINTRPGLIRFYSNLKWLDPGDPESREHSLAVVADVVRRYDIDAVHFDDYFYPYPVPGRAFADDETFARFGNGQSRAEWRRACIDSFVQRVSREIKSIKPGLPFGVSPFGIWRPGFPPGVEGLDAFEVLAADARKWLREGWMDYCCPQLYWRIAAPRQPFAHLLDWWHTQNVQHRHLWPGLYASRLADDADAWPADEILGQIDLARAVRGSTPGFALYSVQALARNAGGLGDALRTGPLATPALPPKTTWLPSPRPAQPPIVSVRDGGALSWFDWSAWDRGQDVRAWTVWTRSGGDWSLRVQGATECTLEVASRGPGAIDAVSIAGVTRGSVEGEAWTMRRID